MIVGVTIIWKKNEFIMEDISTGYQIFQIVVSIIVI
jgi:hypothetical protein